jgi:hypothetical protein
VGGIRVTSAGRNPPASPDLESVLGTTPREFNLLADVAGVSWLVERVMERQPAKFQCDQGYRCHSPCYLCRSGHKCKGAGPSNAPLADFDRWLRLIPVTNWRIKTLTAGLRLGYEPHDVRRLVSRSL